MRYYKQSHKNTGTAATYIRVGVFTVARFVTWQIDDLWFSERRYISLENTHASKSI